MKNHNNLFLTLSLMLCLLLAPVSQAENIQALPTQEAQMDIQIQLQQIMALLQPINVKKVDHVSKDLFKDFFAQKDKLYGYATPAIQNEGKVVAPKKLNRQTF